MNSDRLGELAAVVRSKNAGPFLLTLDIIFNTDDVFDRVVNAKVITRERIGRLFSVEPQAVNIIAFPLVRAVKITMPRRRASGDLEDSDVYAAQQYIPLLDMVVPEPSVNAIMA